MAASWALYLRRRVLFLFGIGFASGLPLALTSGTLSAWLTAEHVDLTTIGLFALVGLPYSVKFLWAPLLDRWSLPWLGRRRGWMVLLQLATAAAIALLGTTHPGTAPRATAVLALTVALLSSSVDVLCDAYSADVLAPDERAAGGATYVFGYRAAMLVSGALALVLADHLPWRTIYWAMAGVQVASTIAAWQAPEPPPATPHGSLLDAVVLPFAEFFRRPGAVRALLFLTLYRLGDAIAGALLTPFLLGLGFSNSELGVVNKGFGLVATIGGALFGGALVGRLGLYRALAFFGVAQALTNLGYAALAHVGRHHGLLVVVVGFDNLTTGLGVAATVAFIMSLCNPRHSATQFALLMSASGVAGRAVAAASGPLATALGWPLFFVATVAGALPALALLYSLRRTLERP